MQKEGAFEPHFIAQLNQLSRLIKKQANKFCNINLPTPSSAADYVKKLFLFLFSIPSSHFYFSFHKQHIWYSKYHLNDFQTAVFEEFVSFYDVLQIEDYSLVSFLPLDITNEDSITLLVAEIDNAIQYGENQEVKEMKVSIFKNLTYEALIIFPYVFFFECQILLLLANSEVIWLIYIFTFISFPCFHILG